jgi:hypothetical protein
VKPLITKSSGKRDRGVEKFSREKSSLTISPRNIETARLKPTDSNRVVIVPMFFICRVLRMTKPGISDR